MLPFLVLNNFFLFKIFHISGFKIQKGFFFIYLDGNTQDMLAGKCRYL